MCDTTHNYGKPFLYGINRFLGFSIPFSFFLPFSRSPPFFVPLTVTATAASSAVPPPSCHFASVNHRLEVSPSSEPNAARLRRMKPTHHLFQHVMRFSSDPPAVLLHLRQPSLGAVWLLFGCFHCCLALFSWLPNQH